MQTSTRKGRPSAASQTMPAFLKEATTRTLRELPISAATSKAIDEYIEWSSGKAQMPKSEALFKFVDHALGEFIRRDGLWQAERHGRTAALAAPPPAAGIPDSPTSPGTIVTPPAAAPRAEKTSPHTASPGRADTRGTSTPAANAGRAS